MHFSRLLCACAGLLSLASGCGEPTYGYQGYQMYDKFPLDGTRQWEYNNEDESINWTLLVEKKDTAIVGENQVVTLEYSNDDTGDLFFTVDWSSDSTDGILLHGYEDIANAASPVTFSSPIQVAEKWMLPGDVVTTETDGFTFTSTFNNVEGCGTYWVPDWDDVQCVVMTIDDGDGDPATNGQFTGTYWLVPRYGIALMELTSSQGRWNLAKAIWDDQEPTSEE